MIELQTAVATLMTLLMNGGPEAAEVLVKGMVLKGAKEASQLWKKVFEEAPEAPLLAGRVARGPCNVDDQQALERLLSKALSEHPEWWQGERIAMGNVTANNGGIAVGVAINSTINKQP